MSHRIDIDNRSLVRECMKGDKEALNLFYTRFAPRMLRLIHRYVANDKDAEDILHDGFIVAFTRLGSLHDPDKVDYWIASIMKNLSLQFLHNQDVAMILHEIPEVEDSTEALDILDLEILESLIKKLPSGYQKVFRLAVLENKSHKEIAKLLGIAPNTSSSQLFHAKMMMRKLISEYKLQAGMLSILILAVSSGLLFLGNPGIHISDNKKASKIATTVKRRQDATTATESPAIKESGPLTPTASKPSSFIAQGNGIVQKSRKPADLSPTDSTNNGNTTTGFVFNKDSIANPAEIASTDKPNVAEVKDDTRPHVDTLPPTPDEMYYARVDEAMIRHARKKGWTAGIGVSPGLANFDNFNKYGDDISSMRPWEDPDNPDKKPNEEPDEKPGTTTRRAVKEQYCNYNQVSHHNYLPISFSLTASKSLSKTIGIETGLTYTYLHTKFESIHSRSHCHWHYIGIPLRLTVKTVSIEKLRMYAAFGGQFDIPVYSNAEVSVIFGENDLRPGRFNASAVWSVSASYGAAFELSDHVEIFIEPTLQHHFEHNHTVPNMWTDNPWNFALPLGIRLNW